MIAPEVVIRPIPSGVANHRLPSGPGVIPVRVLWSGSAKGVAEPVGVRRPMAPCVVNHRLPSGPVVIALAETGNWVK